MKTWTFTLLFAAALAAGCMAGGPATTGQTPPLPPSAQTNGPVGSPFAEHRGVAATLATPLIIDRADMRIGTTAQFDRLPTTADINDLLRLPGLAHVVVSLAGWPSDYEPLQTLGAVPEGCDLIVVLPGYPPSRAAAEAWNYLGAGVRLIVVVTGPPPTSGGQRPQHHARPRARHRPDGRALALGLRPAPAAAELQDDRAVTAYVPGTAPTTCLVSSALRVTENTRISPRLSCGSSFRSTWSLKRLRRTPRRARPMRRRTRSVPLAPALPHAERLLGDGIRGTWRSVSGPRSGCRGARGAFRRGRAGGKALERWADRGLTSRRKFLSLYRLRWTEDGAEHTTSEAWVDVPQALELALDGLRPNPAVRDLNISLVLTSRSHGRIEMLDASGRQRLSRDLSDLGPGRHVLRLGDAREHEPGVYWMKLTHSGRSRIARGVIVR